MTEKMEMQWVRPLQPGRGGQDCFGGWLWRGRSTDSTRDTWSLCRALCQFMLLIYLICFPSITLGCDRGPAPVIIPSL